MGSDITNRLRDIFTAGETVGVEFKRCGNGVEADTYETVCSFLNRFGGDIYLGVEDNGTVIGVPEKSAGDIVKNIVSMVSNPDIISPVPYISPEILDYDGKKIIRIHVPPSSDVHSCKKVIYDRANDADVKVTATKRISDMYIRKHRIYTERKVFPYVKDKHLRLDILPLVRLLARNNSRQSSHPWEKMSDTELLHSAKLIGEDVETGQTGYNLAAIMLLGRDDIILSACPAYRTDALLRKVNVNRYDDRLMVQTNLIESYDELMKFAEVYLPDKFYLENDLRVSLRNTIAREMLVNTLIHREFTSSYIARFIIEKDKMYTENASRAETGGVITPNNYQPNPKNPIIASFFRNIGRADELGSGVRNLYYYVKRYSGKEPQLIDGDIFRVIVPLDDTYSFDAKIGAEQIVDNSKETVEENMGTVEETVEENIGTVEETVEENIDTVEETVEEKNIEKILDIIMNNPNITQSKLSELTGLTRRGVEWNLTKLKEKGLLKREGATKKGKWIVTR